MRIASSVTALALVASAVADLTGVSFPYVNQQAWIDDMLNATNTYRALHSAPAVTWNSDLANAAYTNAAQYTWAHTSNDPYGENIATGTYTDPSYYVYLWYSEESQYDYDNPGYSDATGHFTQLVWVSTTQIGCAMVDADNNLGYPYSMTCEYSPAGNIVNAGYFAANVKPLAAVSSAAPSPLAVSTASMMAAVAGVIYYIL